jgi:hypothetical protein
MKKILIVLLGLLLFCSLASAYKIKYYSPKINETECQKIFNSISSVYFVDLKFIDVMDISNGKTVGRYYPKLIILYDGCNKDTIIHELAHHLQYERKDSWNELITHTGNFKKYEREIWGD